MSGLPIDVLALVVAVIGTIASIWFSAHNKRLMQKQFDMQFASKVQLLIPEPRLILNEARLIARLKNYGPLPASSVNLRVTHQSSGIKLPVSSLSSNITIAPEDYIDVNAYFEVDAILQKLQVYSPQQVRILSREPISLLFEYEWQPTGLTQPNRDTKELTLVWQGGKYDRGLEWDIT